MAVDQNGGLVKLSQNNPHRAQCSRETAFDLGTPGIEGDVVRHIEDNVVALPRDAHSTGPQFLPQHGFLLVHVVANAASSNSADGGADERTTSCVSISHIITNDRAQNCAPSSAEACSCRSVGDLLFPRVRVLGNTTGERGGGQKSHRETLWTGTGE